MNYYLQNPYLRRVLFAVAADMLIFGLAATAAWITPSQMLDAVTFWSLSMSGAFAAFVALYYCDAYSPQVLGSGRANVSSLVSAMALAFVGALVLYFGVQTRPGVVSSMAVMAGVYFPVLFVERLAFRWISSFPRFNERVLVIGASELGLAIARAMRERPNLGIALVGFLSDDEDLVHRQFSLEGYPVLGKVHEIEKVMDARRIGRVVVASKDRDEYFPADELLSAKLRSVRIESGISFYERVTGRIYLRDLRASYLIFSDGFRETTFGRFAKRATDIAGAGLALAISAPVLGIAALLIKLDSPGPVLFRQDRLGLGGGTFEVLKLRSMRIDAEAEGPRFTSERDDRITRVGSFLRKTRIDELPQLLNVLRGDMSFVGPRPERPEFVEAISERYPYFRLRCSVKPGITGWAQIRHGYVNDLAGFEEKLALDLYYLKYRSFQMDMLVVWHTIKTLVTLQGV
jgi:exopolysaccharide biosynthesis polyprenyl glycosylphosphotransferase